MRIVPHHAYIPIELSQLLDKHVLHSVGILVLIKKYVFEPVVIALQNGRLFREQLYWLQKQIVEVHPIELLQFLLILIVHSRRPLIHRVKCVFRVRLRRDHLVLCNTDPGPNTLRAELLL